MLNILPKQIAVVGPDGSGKTTLVQRIEEELKNKDVRVVHLPEVVHKEDYSTLFAAADSAKVLFPYLVAHYTPYFEDAVIFDRSFPIDARVYGKIYGNLGKIVSGLSRFVPLPDEVLFLDVDLETAIERSAKNKLFQYHQTRNNLSTIINQYRSILDKLSKKEKINLHRIDTTQLNETEMINEAMNILNPILSEAEGKRGFIRLYSEKNLKETVERWIELGRIHEDDAEDFLQKIMTYRPLLLHTSVHSAIGLLTPTGVGALASMVARPLWTFGNMAYDKLKHKQTSIHSVDVAALSAIPILGNAAYLFNLIDEPRMLEFFTYHLARHMGKSGLEKKVLEYISNLKVQKHISRAISYLRTNYEIPFLALISYGILTNNPDPQLFSIFPLWGITYHEHIRKHNPSMIPRIFRMYMPTLSSLLIYSNGRDIYSNPQALSLLTACTLLTAFLTVKAANLDEKYTVSRKESLSLK